MDCETVPDKARHRGDQCERCQEDLLEPGGLAGAARTEQEKGALRPLEQTWEDRNLMGFHFAYHVVKLQCKLTTKTEKCKPFFQSTLKPARFPKPHRFESHTPPMGRSCFRPDRNWQAIPTLLQSCPSAQYPPRSRQPFLAVYRLERHNEHGLIEKCEFLHHCFPAKGLDRRCLIFGIPEIKPSLHKQPALG